MMEAARAVPLRLASPGNVGTDTLRALFPDVMKQFFARLVGWSSAGPRIRDNGYV